MNLSAEFGFSSSIDATFTGIESNHRLPRIHEDAKQSADEVSTAWRYRVDNSAL